jgi:hypothetical protein
MQHTGPLSSEQLTFWSDNGYLVIPGFVESAQMRQMKESAVAIMKSVDPSVISVFTTDTKQVKTTDQYAPTAFPRCVSVTFCACTFSIAPQRFDASLKKVPLQRMGR